MLIEVSHFGLRDTSAPTDKSSTRWRHSFLWHMEILLFDINVRSLNSFNDVTPDLTFYSNMNATTFKTTQHRNTHPIKRILTFNLIELSRSVVFGPSLPHCKTFSRGSGFVKTVIVLSHHVSHAHASKSQYSGCPTNLNGSIYFTKF